MNTQAPKYDFSCNKLIKHWTRLDGFQTAGLLTPIAQELLLSARHMENLEVIGKKEKSKTFLDKYVEAVKEGKRTETKMKALLWRANWSIAVLLSQS